MTKLEFVYTFVDEISTPLRFLERGTDLYPKTERKGSEGGEWLAMYIKQAYSQRCT